MAWSSGSSPANVVDVAFCRTKCGKLAVIHEDFYFHHNRKYKGYDYWCCAQRGCKVRLISSRVDPASGRMEFSRRNRTIEHLHTPNAPNLIEKEFRRQLVVKMHRMAGQATPASVRLVYDEIRDKAIQQGVPEQLIPSFWNVRSTMYRVRGRTNSTSGPVSSPGEEDVTPSGSSSSAEDPPQNEPLSLVVRERKDREDSDPMEKSGSGPSSYQQFSSPSSSSTISTSGPETTEEVSIIVTSSSTAPSMMTGIFQQSQQPVPSFLIYQPAMVEHYAALQHALYMRSLIALSYPFL